MTLRVVGTGVGRTGSTSLKSDGWEPLATALGVPVPDEPFPHANTTEQFRSFSGLDT